MHIKILTCKQTVHSSTTALDVLALLIKGRLNKRWDGTPCTRMT